MDCQMLQLAYALNLAGGKTLTVSIPFDLKTNLNFDISNLEKSEKM